VSGWLNAWGHRLSLPGNKLFSASTGDLIEQEVAAA
jgi:hypothetical protein